MTTTTMHATFRLNCGATVYSADGGESPWRATNRTQAARKAGQLRSIGLRLAVFQSYTSRVCFYLVAAELVN